MNRIRPLDLVRLKQSPEWTGRVDIVEVELDAALVVHADPKWLVWVWLRIDWLELLPGQIERMAA